MITAPFMEDKSMKGDVMNKHQKYDIEQIVYRWSNRGNISIGRVFALLYMAENDIRPDGTFGDDECDIWSEIRRLMNKKN